MLELLPKALSEYFDLEMKQVASIINKTPNELIENGEYNDLMKECDSVFIDRLKFNKSALKLNFWKTHFELDGFNHFPEITGHVLDFGCGSGHLDIFLARRGMRITGIDASPIAIKICEFLKRRESKLVASRLNFLHLDITEANVKRLAFDNVWSTQVFEHITDPAPIIKGVSQFVKKDAYFLICVPFGHAYDDPGHCNYFFSAMDLENFLSPHIRVIKVKVDIQFNVIRALCQF